MKKARYIGADADDTQFVRLADTMFIKGQWTDVDDTHPQFAKIATNPTFEVKGGEERDEPETDDVQEVERLKTDLRDRGIAVRGNPNADTLRKRLSAVVADEDAPARDTPVVGG